MRSVPGYWMYETSGALRLAVNAWLAGDPLTDRDIAALRAYLREWICCDAWQGADDLKAGVDKLTSRAAISAWLVDAYEIGIDPL